MHRYAGDVYASNGWVLAPAPHSPERAGRPSQPADQVPSGGQVLARLGPVWGLVIALSFALGYGIYDLAARRKLRHVALEIPLAALAFGRGRQRRDAAG